MFEVPTSNLLPTYAVVKHLVFSVFSHKAAPVTGLAGRGLVGLLAPVIETYRATSAVGARG